MESTENNSSTKYSVGDMYKKSWEVVKKNLMPLAIVTLIGVAVNVAISAIVTFAAVNNLIDDVSSAVVSSLIAGAVGILASVFVGLLQVIALKRVSEGKSISPGEVINESMKFVPRALGYGLFVFAIFVAGGIVTFLLSEAAGVLGALAGIAFMVGLVIAIFRYAFVQFLIVEPKEMAFIDRFKTSYRLTKGIYSTLFMMWLMALVLAIGGGIVGGILSSPFNSKAEKSISTSVDYDFNNVQSLEDFRSEVNKVSKESVKEQFGANYVLKQIIMQTISWGIGLVVLGALLELYHKRKASLHIQ